MTLKVCAHFHSIYRPKLGKSYDRHLSLSPHSHSGLCSKHVNVRIQGRTMGIYTSLVIDVVKDQIV
jgi:hypothetical protein